ncbi:hypothetical protein [Methylobacterium mesophilicum]
MSAHRYIILDKIITEVDIANPSIYGWGFDYYLNVLKLLDRQVSEPALTFYISYKTPEFLPTYGPDVILIILADESYQHRAYFRSIKCILRCLGSTPVYLDGFPNRALKIAALIHYAYKKYTRYKSIVRSLTSFQKGSFPITNNNVYHIPLGFFSSFNPKYKPVLERDIDCSFLGSIDFASTQKKLIHSFFQSPKILSRKQMAIALDSAPKFIKQVVKKTDDFEDSIKDQSNYEIAMGETKIAIVPRGTSYETFRFFEACKAGCVIICEPLPDEWCYQGHPGIEIQDWSDLPLVLNDLIMNNDRLVKKSEESRLYYENKLTEEVMAMRLKSIIELYN